jgi:hypothetical protein
MTQHNNNSSHPFRVDGSGRTAIAATDDEHIRQVIEQVLFTSPGERVNRPTFGSGVNQLLFAPNSNELAAATQFMVQGALQQWLGNLIHVESVTVTHSDSTLHILVQYVVKRSQRRETAEFAREV